MYTELLLYQPLSLTRDVKVFSSCQPEKEKMLRHKAAIFGSYQIIFKDRK